jgi:hypothetical protein
MATFQVFQAVGNREDLIDMITTISPVDTWFTSNSGSVRAKNASAHDWQTDALAAAGANAQVEGSDASAGTVTPTVRLTNACQILRKTFLISNTQEAVDKAGRASEIDYQTMKHSKELARDIEYALIINASLVTGASDTARQLKGVLGFITTNETTATATSEEVSETLLNDNLGLIWAQGGRPTNTLVGGHVKRRIDAFTTNTRNVSADSSKVVSAIDVYQSSYGTIAIRLHHQVNTTAPGTLINLGEMSLWRKAWLRPVMREELAKAGSARKFMIEAELTLESGQEKGSGKMTGYYYGQ